MEHSVAEIKASPELLQRYVGGQKPWEFYLKVGRDAHVTCHLYADHRIIDRTLLPDHFACEMAVVHEEAPDKEATLKPPTGPRAVFVPIVNPATDTKKRYVDSRWYRAVAAQILKIYRKGDRSDQLFNSDIDAYPISGPRGNISRGIIKQLLCNELGAEHGTATGGQRTLRGVTFHLGYRKTAISAFAKRTKRELVQEILDLRQQVQDLTPPTLEPKQE